MFTKALDWEMVTEDVVKRVRKLKRISGSGERLRYLSLEECQRLIAASDKQLKPIVTLAIHTGCRRGEILGLTWDRVDLKHGFYCLTKRRAESAARYL